MSASPDETLPWRRLMEIGMGVLGWGPDQFWSATLRDFNAAFAGWQEAHGAAKDHDAYRSMAAAADKFPKRTKSIVNHGR
jgi:uncharacterized phage protein (TIGR02216 family)